MPRGNLSLRDATNCTGNQGVLRLDSVNEKGAPRGALAKESAVSPQLEDLVPNCWLT